MNSISHRSMVAKWNPVWILEAIALCRHMAKVQSAMDAQKEKNA